MKRNVFKDIEDFMLPPSVDRSVLVEMEKICRQEINRGSSVKQIERVVEERLFRELFQGSGIFHSIEERALRISDQLLAGIRLNNIPVTPATHFLDFGCGSGVVAATLKNAFGFKRTMITDIVDYRYPEVKADAELHFEQLEPFYRNIANDGRDFDLVTMTNVLHHCDNPTETFEKALRHLKTGGYMLIIESCIGITEEQCRKYSGQPIIPHQELYGNEGQITDRNITYLKYNFKEKMIYGIFFDWLYNRAFVNEDINVPYNFAPPQQWNRYWEHLGLTVKNTYLMGFDQPSVLEFHTLHVIQKN